MKSLSDERCHSRHSKERNSNTGVISYIRSYLSNKMNHTSDSSGGNSSRFSGTSASDYTSCDFTSSLCSVDRCHKKMTPGSLCSSSSSSLKGTKSHLYNQSSDRKSYVKSSTNQPEGQVKSTIYTTGGNCSSSNSNSNRGAFNPRSSHKYHQATEASSSSSHEYSKSTNCNRLSHHHAGKSSGFSSSTAQSTFSLTSGYASSSSSSKRSIMPLFDPRAEITRKYIVPPPNRSINDITSALR